MQLTIEEAEKRMLKWQTTVPSNSDPAVFYTVKAYTNRDYDCDCPGRKYQFICHHIAGAIILLEGRKVPQRYRAVSSRPTPKSLDPVYLNNKRLAHTSIETWHDELFQKYLSASMGTILRFVIAHPGVCSAEVADGLETRRDYITHALRLLVDANLLDDTITKPNPSTGRKNKAYYPTKLAGV